MKELFLFFTIPEKIIRFFDNKIEIRFGEKVSSKSIYAESTAKESSRSFQTETIEKVPDEIELSINDLDFASVNDLKEAIEFKA
jgi:hypothetical protein